MPTVDELAARIAVLQKQVPTLEELVCTVGIQSWRGAAEIKGATRMTLLVAPVPMRILSVAASWEYWNLPVSDTVYWTGVLEKGDGPGGFPDIATRSTRSTGPTANGGVVARKAWTWDAAAWANADLATGQLLTIDWKPTGNPAAMALPMTLTVRYRPL